MCDCLSRFYTPSTSSKGWIDPSIPLGRVEGWSRAACLDPFFLAPFVNCGLRRSQFDVAGLVFVFLRAGRLGLAMASRRRAFEALQGLQRLRCVQRLCAAN